MKKLFGLLLLLLVVGCTKKEETPQPNASGVTPEMKGGALTIYCGREKELVEGIFERFTAETGVKIDVKYGKTAQLALQLSEEGTNSPADIFWGQDAGSLSAVAAQDLFSDLPENIRKRVAPAFEHSKKGWTAVTGRVRVLAYSTERVKTTDLPASVADLSNPKYKEKLGWAPENASFQAFVTAMRKAKGDAETKKWLEAVKNNGAKPYPSNGAIVEAIAAGEVDYGLTNHYYLFGFKAKNPNFPVAQTPFKAGDLGNMLNVSGAGILKSTKNLPVAEQFMMYLLSNGVQSANVSGEEKEYAVVPGVEVFKDLRPFADVAKEKPAVDLGDLADLEGTLNLLREVGLL
jgi:iron(III) transport system substrate-binding protein